MKDSFQLPTPLPPHPRLFFAPGDHERLLLKIDRDPVGFRIYNSLRRSADLLLPLPPLERVQIGKRILLTSREMLRRIGLLALVARVSGDKKYAHRAIIEMESAASFKDWNPSNYLDTAELTLGMAIGLDWIHHEMSEAQREKIAEAIIQMGLIPSEAKSPEEEKWCGWIRGDNNWNQVCHAGLSAGALAVADRAPALAERIIARAIENISYGAHAYAPDGAYPEGPTYWNYGTSFHVILAALLRSLTGQTWGTDSYPGFYPSADYIAHATAPSGRFYNYSDSSLEHAFLTPLVWMAAQKSRFDWLRFETEHLDQFLRDYEKNDSGTIIESYRLFFLALVWWQSPESGVSGAVRWASPKSPSRPLFWTGSGNVPVSFYRSKWEESEAFYLGIKGGSPSAHHAHMDAGSFILESQGIRWAVDSGKQDYEAVEKLKLGLWDGSQKGDRWKIFKLGPESHSLLRFNHSPQNVKGVSTPLFQSERNGVFQSVWEMSSLYAGEALQVWRGFQVLHGDSLLVQDEWTLDKPESTVTWQMMTEADIALVPGGALLQQEGKKLKLIILDLSPENYEITVRAASDFQKPYDDPTPFLKRIDITLRSGEKSGLLRVFLTPEAGGASVPSLLRHKNWC
jgi:hypothetical protein